MIFEYTNELQQRKIYALQANARNYKQRMEEKEKSRMNEKRGKEGVQGIKNK
jgi:CRISPR/Cas system-associated endonuclease Cas1